jgi:hypothetical protein
MIGSVMRRPECITTRSVFFSCAAALPGHAIVVSARAKTAAGDNVRNPLVIAPI